MFRSIFKRQLLLYSRQTPKRYLTQKAEDVSKVNQYPRFKIIPETHGKWISVKDLERYQTLLEKGQKAEQDIVTLTGRINSKRESSAKLVFYDIVQNGETVQVVASRNRFNGTFKDFEESNRQLSRGDIVSFTGVPGKTNHGQLSVFVTKEMKVLTPCLRDIPLSGLKDHEKRFRQRHLDLLVNPTSVNILKTRSKIVRYIRDFFDSRGFLEVETPVLSTSAGGANARPFETHAHALDVDMQLRIAPELYLKRLVIGGMDRVYEIGKQFRNEGVDADHNPEFTTCESYQAYGNLETLMSDTEELLSGMVAEVCGNKPVMTKTGHMVDFKKPFNRINVMERLSSVLGTSLSFLDSPDALDRLIEICKQLKVHPSEPLTTTRILDELISVYIEPECVQPTFLYNHPLALSPLAKDAIDDNGQKFAARFELFIGGKEIVNAYEELNDPEEQRKRRRGSAITRYGLL
ncbi:Putative Lysine--tRNA ligase [Rhizopus microsporus]|nr:Putative Lysine--tRNA ligase [Rhizopus microsporus]